MVSTNVNETCAGLVGAPAFYFSFKSFHSVFPFLPEYVKALSRSDLSLAFAISH